MRRYVYISRFVTASVIPEFDFLPLFSMSCFATVGSTTPHFCASPHFHPPSITRALDARYCIPHANFSPLFRQRSPAAFIGRRSRLASCAITCIGVPDPTSPWSKNRPLTSPPCPPFLSISTSSDNLFIDWVVFPLPSSVSSRPALPCWTFPLLKRLGFS